jgi:hypothetical protein
VSASIEWGHESTGSTYILGHHEEAGDHQKISDDSDNPAEVGLMFSDFGGNGFCLVGEPARIIRLLTTAIDQLAERITDEDRIASEEAKR